MSYQERIASGDVLGAFRQGVVYGALWVIGTSWSTAIREIARLLVPDDTLDSVLAELLAAVVSTALAIGLSVGVMRCKLKPKPDTRVDTIVARRRPRK